jgi:hypothetical protein
MAKCLFVTCFKRERGHQTRETESLGHSERKFALTLFLFETDFYVVLKVLPKKTFMEGLSLRLSILRFRTFYCDPRLI